MKLTLRVPGRGALAGVVIAGSTVAASAVFIWSATPHPATAQEECSIADLRDDQVDDKLVTLNDEQAAAAYECMREKMHAAYAAADHPAAAGVVDWLKSSTQSYQSATHGNRYVQNFAHPDVAEQYALMEEAGDMAPGSLLAKDSYAVKPDGSVVVGPLFIMEKMEPGARESTGDWDYTLVFPNGNQKNDEKINKFCADCHLNLADVDSMLFVPEEYRIQ